MLKTFNPSLFLLTSIVAYSDIAVPLTHLTHKGTPWVFSDDCHKSFEFLKNTFTTAPILVHWEPDRHLVMETDTSDYTLAVIISMKTSEGELHPITFHSCTFTGAKLNYNVHDKELMAIFEAFKHWRHYLEGSASPIDVVTDHKNVEYFCTTKLLTQRQAHWSKYLLQFNFIIRFHCYGPSPKHVPIYPEIGTTLGVKYSGSLVLQSYRKGSESEGLSFNLCMCCATVTSLSLISEIGVLEYGWMSGPRRELRKDYDPGRTNI